MQIFNVGIALSQLMCFCEICSFVTLYISVCENYNNQAAFTLHFVFSLLSHYAYKTDRNYSEQAKQ